MPWTLLRGAGVTLLVAWFVLPFVPILLWAFADRWPSVGSGSGVLPDWGLTGWPQALDAGILAALARSAALGLVVAVIATPLGALAGRALGWRIGRRLGIPAALILAPVALPPFALAMGLDVVLLRLGIPQTMAVVVLLTVFALPYTTYVLRSAYAGLDAQVEDQARMLGASRWQAIRSVTLPALAPALSAAAALAFLVGWSDYVVTVVIGGGRLVTAPVLVASSAAGTGSDPLVAVLSLAVVLPLLATVGLSAVLARRSVGAGLR
ncbi:MAG: ABC transporter permease [Ornithinimicrobium sp.]|uniref:ABC transporter permease n=1 Tax=Ornithinimicrobium sp. TaxID=1977084 RepID=UPI003D9BF5E0